ncbi:MAG: tetratricopeptide repeat protein [Bacteroidia bacterium]
MCVLLFSGIEQNIRAQVKKDSLRAAWYNESLSDSSRLQAIMALSAMGYLRYQPDSAFYYGGEWFEFAKEKNLTREMAVAFTLQATAKQMMGQYPEAIEYFKNSLPYFEAITVEVRYAMALGSIGLLYWELGDFENALAYDQKALEVNVRLGDRNGEARALNNIGLVYEDQGNYPNALDYYFRSIKIFEELEEHGYLGNCLHNVGNIYNSLGNDSSAIEYHTRSLKEREIVDDKEGIAYSLEAIGVIYFNKKDYVRAMDYEQQSLKIREEINHEKGIAMSLKQIGQIHAAEGREKEALELFSESMKLFEKIGNKEGVAQALNHLGKLYIKNNNFRQAEKYLQQSLEISRETGLIQSIKDNGEALYEVYKKQGRYAEALAMYELFVDMSDSIRNEDNVQALFQQQIQYDYDKKALSDSLNFVQEKASTEMAYRSKLNQRNYLLFGGLALAVFGFLLFRYRQQLRARQRLEQIDQMKDQFLANTSHELRTPLNGIIGITESLLDQATDEETRYNLELVVTSGKRLASLVNDLLDFSRIRNADIVLQQKPVDLHSMVNIIFRTSGPLLHGKTLELRNRISPDLKPVFADENRLTQILFNLTGNAIKFTEAGYVEVRANENNGMIEVAVEDTGIGIAADKTESIFEAFSQADGSISRSFGGTGLGLSISRSLVNKHGGKMWVESEPGKGSTFYFTLPVSAIAAEKTSGSQNGAMLTPLHVAGEKVKNGKTIPPTKIKQGTSSIRILIVDDEPINHQVLKNHLRDSRFEVVSAMNGGEAIEILEKDLTFDLVLLDIMMPRMSGYQVCEIIRSKRLASELPVIMITAKNQVEDLVVGLNVGANDYLAKPFNKDEFMARLNTHLNLHQISQATSRFVPVEFIKTLGRNTIAEIQLGDNIAREVTVFFSDIRGYTTLAEKMTPEENFRFVNSYARRMGPVIHAHNGFINQYLGDGIMALFQQSPADAVRASVQMQAEIRNYNKSRLEVGRDPIHVGMGMHVGPLVMGIIGDSQRTDAAIIADTVNTAARLEGLTKYYKANIMMSDGVYVTLLPEEKEHCRFLGKVQLKGKKEPVGIYESLDGDDEQIRDQKLDSINTFSAGVKAYLEGDFVLAEDVFSQAVAQVPDDKTAAYFLLQTRQFLETGAPAGWNGVVEMDAK